MSLLPVFVLATNNKYYQNPMICGPDYFINFDDEDGAEIVIDLEQKNERLPQIIDELGISATLASDVIIGRRYHIAKASFINSFYAYLDIDKPIPHEIINHCDGVHDTKPACDGVFYIFG